MDLENHWLSTVGLITSSLIAITSNSLLLLVFCRRRGLRTVSNRFVINLLFINLLSGLLLVPFLIVDKQAGRKVPILQNFNISTAEIIEKIPPEKTVNISKEIIYEKQSSRIVNGTLFESRQLLIDNRSDDVDDLEIIEANFSLDFSQKANPFFCKISQLTLNFICTASILSILLIGVDQYFAVLHPLRCHSYINKTKSVVFIVVTWVVSALSALITALTDTNNNYFYNLCPREENTNANFVYALIYFIVIIFIPFVAICLIYVLIYRAAHKNSSRMRKRNNVNSNPAGRKVPIITIPNEPDENPTPQFLPKPTNRRILPPPVLQKVHSAPNLINELKEFPSNPQPARTISIKRTHSERPNKNLISSIKTKISNASVFRYREESRTAKISILVIFLVFICYIPYGILFILNTKIPMSNTLHNLNYTSLILLIISDLLSPVLFAYRNKRIQRELKKFITLHFSRNQYNLTRPKIVVNHIETELNKSTECIEVATEPFLVPEIVFECKLENERKSILKRVCSKNWSNYKKCSFINVPDSCLDARGSFSSASTQISTED